MTDAINTFFGAWGEADADARAAALGAAMADNFTYIDPRTDAAITDMDALAAYVGMFSANAPGWTATVATLAEQLGYARAVVAFGGMGPDGSQMVQHGSYFVEMAGDKIAKIVGFVGTGAPE